MVGCIKDIKFVTDQMEDYIDFIDDDERIEELKAVCGDDWDPEEFDDEDEGAFEDDDEGIGPDEPESITLTTESIDGLTLGMTHDQVKAKLGKPDSMTEPEFEGATGCDYSQAVWESNGYIIEYCQNQDLEQIEPHVRAIVAVAPAPGKTVDDIGVGTHVDDVMRMYGDTTAYDEENGLMLYFEIEGEKVVLVMLGWVPE